MVHLPTLSSEPQGSGSLPRLTSSQGEHKRSPFSWNTHLPGTGHSLALPTLPTQPLSHCLGTDSGPTYPPIRLQVWSDSAEVTPGRPDPPGLGNPLGLGKPDWHEMDQLSSPVVQMGRSFNHC